jgi:predicted transcriptional regulator
MSERTREFRREDQSDVTHIFSASGYRQSAWASFATIKKPKIICMSTDSYHVGVRVVKARTERNEWIGTVRCEHGRRGRQDIIMGILGVAKCGNSKTRLIDKVHMSSIQCSKYLENLKEAGYISVENGIWKTTEKGLQVIDACKICHSLMNLT